MDRSNVVFRTLSFMEATLVKSLLEGSGIEVYLFDENISRLNPFYSSAVGGIQLLVPDDQLEKARETLREYREKEGQDPSVGRNASIGLDLTGSDDGEEEA